MATISAADKRKILDTIIREQNKKSNEGSVIGYGDQTETVARFTSGSPKLDVILGGGVPRGRIVEIFGPEGSGKTTLATEFMIAVQQNRQSDGTCLNDGTVAFMDVENAFDMEYAVRLGLDPDPGRFVISQPPKSSSGLDAMEALATSGVVDLIVIDSVAALASDAELEGEMGDQQMGATARMMGKFLRKIIGPAARNKCTIVFTNQIREKIGVMFGNPEVQPGGRALKFAASVRLDIRSAPGERIKIGEDVIGQKLNIKTVKNKVAMPFRKAEGIELIYGKGLDEVADLHSLGVEFGIIEKKGNSLSYTYTTNGESRTITGAGKDAFRRNLGEDPAAAIALTAAVMERGLRSDALVIGASESEESETGADTDEFTV